MIKPVFGIDETLDKDNEQSNAEAFCVAKVSDECSKALDEGSDEAMESVERAKLPLPLRIMEYVCGFAVLVILVGILRADVGLAEAYQNAAWMFWLGGACLLVWAVLAVAARQKSKSVIQSEEVRDNERELEQNLQRAYRELGVPAQAADVDILMFCYTVKNGEVQVKKNTPVPYLNMELKLFCEGDRLCIADAHERYEFPLREIRGIRTVNKRIHVPFWNKKLPHNSEEYKRYKITSNNIGMIFFKPYYILELDHGGEQWGIHFPCYELPVIEALTGHFAQDQK